MGYVPNCVKRIVSPYRLGLALSRHRCFNLSHRHLAGMADEHVKTYPGAHIERNAVDLYRCAITEKLVEITGISSDLIYPALQWQNNPANGDLVLAIPRLRVKGATPDELGRKWADEWAQKVFPAPCS